MENFFKNKKILIIGGTGTVGKALTKKVLEYDPAVIRIFSRDEFKQYIMEKEFNESPKLRFLVGDVRDEERLERAMENIDYVFNLAAMKHVPACEYNPFEAVKTNIIGVQNVIEAAIQTNVEKVIYTSSDKAIAPTNTMGATKLVSERIITAANYYKGAKRTVFSSVRFGNVMGSRGSVIPLIKKQINEGSEITITNRDMSRFVMTINEAVNLILNSAKLSKGGEIFVSKMPVVNIGEFIDICVEEYCKLNNKDLSKIKFKTIGLRLGEKMYEELMTVEEVKNTYEYENMYIIVPQDEDYTVNSKWIKTERSNYNSEHEDVIPEQEIRRLVTGNGLLMMDD